MPEDPGVQRLRRVLTGSQKGLPRGVQGGCSGHGVVDMGPRDVCGGPGMARGGFAGGHGALREDFAASAKQPQGSRSTPGKSRSPGKIHKMCLHV